MINIHIPHPILVPSRIHILKFSMGLIPIHNTTLVWPHYVQNSKELENSNSDLKDDAEGIGMHDG